MRILAIRGENLASLYGAFEVRLDEAPIAGAGLFCISGPTGAGKSTVLDALCLALYGRTPRTRERGGVLVGREDQAEADRIAANDPRALLSRGTGDGHAEVEFEGEGGVYRARWSVRRARGQAGGRLQVPTMTLHEVGSGRPIGEGLAGVQEEIAKRVGYSFDEFCRAVLLPQFEFTNFLRAKPDERAAILERVTGKELYTAVSIRAHEKAADFNRQLKSFDVQIEGTQVLDAAARAELEAEVGRCEADVLRIGGELEEARKAVEWYEREAILADELATAEVALAAAHERDAEAEPRRVELAGVEAAQPLRSVRDEAVSAEKRAVDVRREVERLAEAARIAGEEARRAREALALAEAAASKARAAAEAAAPELERAKVLDRGIDAAHEAVAKAEGELSRVVANVEASRKEVAVHEAAAATARAVKAEAAAWLEGHRDRLPLADGWSRWEAELVRHGQAVGALAVAEKALAEALANHDSAVTTREAASVAEREREERAGVVSRAAEEADTASAGVDRMGLATRREVLAAHVAALAELARLSENAAAAENERASARLQVEESAALVAAGTAELERLAGERSIIEARLAEARENYELLRQSLAYEDARTTLEDGRPCPLCGSLQHPWAHGSPLGLVEERKTRIARLEGEFKTLGERQFRVEKDRAVARERGERAAADAANAERELSAALAGYERLAREHGVMVAPEAAAPALAKLGAEANVELTALKVREREAERLLADANRLRKAAESERAALEKARAARVTAEHELAAAAHRVELLEGERARSAGDRVAAEEHLDAALSFRDGWRDEARRDPTQFLSSCRTLVKTIGERREQGARADREIDTAARALEGARARLAEREESHGASAAERDMAVAHRDGLVAERLALLGGRSAAEVERAHGDAVKGADEARERVRVARDHAVQRFAVAEGARGRAAEQGGTLAAEAAAAEKRLADALAGAGLDRATLDRRLTPDPARISAVREELSALRKAVHIARTLREERARKVEDHWHTARPALDREATIMLRQQGAAALASAEAARDAARFRRQSDDEAHARIGNLVDERKALEKTARPWQTLAELIGSSDGKKFRMFVQGLAFDLLLSGANGHLAELARRYRLARVPGTDLDLQVIDQDLGDEVRSINGLSGGETFLVSLALALGLATLSTRADHARTLFIDEGFGTLDRDTLDHAMVALEGLQSAGRTVGVISHVPELHERVGVRVEVQRVAVGRSRVTVRGPG